MSSIPLINGATNVLKIKPKSLYIPTPVSSMDNLFKFSNLSSSKFNAWKAIGDTSSKVGIVNSVDGLKSDIYMDNNYNISTNSGTLWFLGPVNQDTAYYLQTGPSLSSSNSSSVFTDQSYLISEGFSNSSGNPVDRCGNYNGVSSNLSYSEEGIIDTGNGYSGTSSKITYGAVEELNEITNFTISLVLKTASYTGSIFDHYNANLLWFDETFGNLISPDIYVVYTNFTAPDYITLDQFFQLDIVFDGTKSDSDVDVQDQMRYKIYIDGEMVDLSIVSGHIPSVTHNVGEGPYNYGGGFYDFNGVIDEARVSLRSFNQNEIVVRHNQWFNQDDYWDITVQPIISSITYLNYGRWQIDGSGFIPESSNPIGTIGGVPITVESGTDTSIIIKSGKDTPAGVAQLVLTNSDGESDYYSIPTNTKRQHSVDSPENYLGMPPKEVNTPVILNDTKFGNPLGNIVDRSSGDNFADGSKEGKPVQTSRGSSGHSLSMYSKPSWLYPRQ